MNGEMVLLVHIVGTVAISQLIAILTFPSVYSDFDLKTLTDQANRVSRRPS